MEVAVLGAGVVGITSAYFLSEAGHKVTVVDCAAEVASQCSFANGAQLSYSYTDAMATPAFLAKIPAILAGLDHGVRIAAPLSCELLAWARAFVAQCSNRNAAYNTLAPLALAQRSKQLMNDLRSRLDGDFSHRTAGKIVLLSSNRERDAALQNSELKARHGCETSIISLAEAVAIEPAIEYMTGSYKAAMYAPGDDAGDARKFSRMLAADLSSRSSFKLQLSTRIERIITHGGRVRAIATDRGKLDIDAAVVCLGTWSAHLLKTLGIRTLIYPVRGYSITLPPGSQANSVSITDHAGRFVVSRIGEQMRIAGFADFLGFSSSRDAERIGELQATARHRAPLVARYVGAVDQAWGGFRPMTPDGLPLLGPTPIHGLYLNTGHGSLGWTLACASAERLANSIPVAGDLDSQEVRPHAPATAIRI